jgi:hypothetical protein
VHPDRYHFFRQCPQQCQRGLLPLHIPTHQTDFQKYAWFAQGFAPQFVVAMNSSLSNLIGSYSSR